jgi:hypothetical protein
MKPDEGTMLQCKYRSNGRRQNFVFQKPEDEDGIFTKRTMSEFISNLVCPGTFAGSSVEVQQTLR